MNEQSAISYVYFIKQGTHYKIGKSNNPQKRIIELQTAAVVDLTLVYTIECPSSEKAFALEKKLHKIFMANRVTGEWFNIATNDLENILTEHNFAYVEHEQTNFQNKMLHSSFIMVGSGISSKRTTSMDYTKMLLGLTKPAAYMFGTIMDNRKPEIDEKGQESLYLKTNYSHVRPDPADSVAVKYFTKGYKELREKDMLVRIKQGEYLINPSLVISGNNWVIEQIAYKNAVNGTNSEILTKETKIVNKPRKIIGDNPLKYQHYNATKHQELYDELQNM